uniref:Uncharacterized protein n=1 Tax=Anguilla anguilla TaxID=7936 RepID=A0A0E9PBW9_ANGAN
MLKGHVGLRSGFEHISVRPQFLHHDSEVIHSALLLQT